MRRIILTRHAVEQAERRFNELHPTVHVEQLVREEVADALRCGRVFDRRPDGFRLYGEKDRPLAKGQRVMLSEDGLRAYIVVDGSLGHSDRRAHIVITSLSYAGVSKRIRRRPTKDRRAA
jgi:hypothetical protein